MAIHHKARPRKDSSATTAASEDGAAEDEHYTTGEMVEVDVA
ncbi:unnamed protein product [Amoebophrya sp. A25]|nr:unnamed protein product [Amoebophrya sp. A25]|eukprot:GSA25T00019221001.1